MSAAANPPFLTVFTGNDTISREREREELVAAITAAHGEIEEHPFNADGDTVASLCERIMTPSLFGTARIFSLRNAARLGAADIASLDALLRTDIGDVHVIVEAGTPPEKRGAGRKPSGFDAWVKKVGKAAGNNPELFLVRSLSRPRDFEIPGWLVAHVPSLLGRRIAKPDAEYLVDLVGCDFDSINAQLQKLDIYLPDKAPITREAIARTVEGSRAINGYELAHALGKQDLVRATELVDSLFGTSFYAPPVIAALFRHFWALYRITLFAGANPDTMCQFSAAQRSFNKGIQNTLGTQIGCAAGLLTPEQGNRVYPVIIKSGIVEQALSYPLRRYRTIFSLLRNYDYGSKCGRVDVNRRSFELLCYRIVRCAAFDTLTMEL